MKLCLNDDEIREALAEALGKKVNYAFGEIDPEKCWFEVKAGVIDGNEVTDIHDVEFCYDTSA
jgi:hypothetical protein